MELGDQLHFLQRQQQLHIQERLASSVRVPWNPFEIKEVGRNSPRADAEACLEPSSSLR